MRRITAITAAAVLMVLLSACASSGPITEREYLDRVNETAFGADTSDDELLMFGERICFRLETSDDPAATMRQEIISSDEDIEELRTVYRAAIDRFCHGIT